MVNENRAIWLTQEGPTPVADTSRLLRCVRSVMRGCQHSMAIRATASRVPKSQWLCPFRSLGPAPARRSLIAGGAYIAFYVCAPRTRTTSLSPRPTRGLFWLLNGPARQDAGATRHRRAEDSSFENFPLSLACIVPQSCDIRIRFSRAAIARTSRSGRPIT